MPDVFTQTKRSEVMSRIRSRGNKDTRLALIAVFRCGGAETQRRCERSRSGRLWGRCRRGASAALTFSSSFW